MHTVIYDPDLRALTITIGTSVVRIELDADARFFLETTIGLYGSLFLNKEELEVLRKTIAYILANLKVSQASRQSLARISEELEETLTTLTQAPK